MLLQLAGPGDAQSRRQAAAEILNAPTPEVIKALAAILESKGNPEAKLAICEALVACKLQPPGLAAPLLGVVSQKDTVLRRAALIALQTYEDAGVAEKVKVLLQEEQAALLAESHAGLMKALYECTPEADRPVLLLAWLKQSLSLERLVGLDIAQQALRKGDSDPAILAQTRSMLDDPDEAVRQKAVLVLRTWGLREDAPRIEAMLKTEQPAAVREAIYNALGVLGEPESISAVAAGLADTSPSVAAEAATALGRLSEAQPVPDKALWANAVKTLLKLTDRPVENEKLRERVMDAMASMADPQFLPTLARHARAEELVPAIRQAAIRGLGKSGDAAQIALVISRLNSDPDAGVREAAAEALGKLGSTIDHLQPLRDHLEPKTEPAAAVQAKAWEAYQHIFARLPWPEQKSNLETWSSAESATAARRIDLLVCLEKSATVSHLSPAHLSIVREQLGDALIAASRPADAAAVLARQLEGMGNAPPQVQARFALKLVESYLKSGAPEKALAAAATLQQEMARDAVAARLLRFVESVATTDGTAALVFLDKLKAAVPDQFGATWAARFKAVRSSIRPSARNPQSRGE